MTAQLWSASGCFDT